MTGRGAFGPLPFLQPRTRRRLSQPQIDTGEPRFQSATDRRRTTQNPASHGDTEQHGLGQPLFRHRSQGVRPLRDDRREELSRQHNREKRMQKRERIAAYVLRGQRSRRAERGREDGRGEIASTLRVQVCLRSSLVHFPSASRPTKAGARPFLSVSVCVRPWLISVRVRPWPGLDRSVLQRKSIPPTSAPNSCSKSSGVSTMWSAPARSSVDLSNGPQSTDTVRIPAARPAATSWMLSPT